MTSIQTTVSKYGAALLAIINAIAGAGIHLPTGVDAQGVQLVSAAVLAVAAVVFHFIQPSAPAA